MESRDLRKLEGFQRRCTRQVDGTADMNYQERLKHLGLFSISGRLLSADLVKVWKIFNSSQILSGILDTRTHPSTRGHAFKLAILRCRTDIKHRFFSARVVETWNRLPVEIVMASTVGQFLGVGLYSCDFGRD